nr:putative membrane protein [Quercus suber]
MFSFTTRPTFIPFVLFSALPVGVLSGDVLTTSGYSTCLNDATIQVTALDATYNRNTRVVDFNVAGSSSQQQYVTATLDITAYGQNVYTKSFDPCQYNMTRLCPGKFAKIPSIAFNIPDLDGLAKLTLQANGTDVACVQSTVGNGKSLANMPAVRYAAAGVAGAALALSAVSAVGAAGHPGASTSSPSFGEVIGWFQGMALNGMMSVKYPQVYQGFTTNFGFSTGLVPWGSMQTTIDNFRKATGGNTTDNNYEYLKNNVTLVYDNGSNSSSSSTVKRAINTVLLWARDGSEVVVNGTAVDTGEDSTTNNSTTSTANDKTQKYVNGIQAYVEQLSIPSANTFMTVLLIWCCVVAAVIVCILLLKFILEAWSMFGNIPKSMESWRKRYWWRLAKAVTNLILLLYGSWTLYCVYQFTNGDSWAAILLAAVTFSLFTIVLAGFTWRIYSKAHAYRKMDGDTSRLYDDKETWLKYNLFYENYKQGCWWLFVPTIVYMFARGAVIAGANGHGLIQTGGQLIVEGVFLIVLLWYRPYQRKSGVWINIFIQVVRVLSVVCILVFVEELGISQTTKTITGVVLIVVQSVLTGVLAILIAVNALITCIRENPHRRQRKAREKAARDFDNLTPLDARNSLLMENMTQPGSDGTYKAPLVAAVPFSSDRKGRYDPVRPSSPETGSMDPPRFRDHDDEDDQQRLVSDAASMGHGHGRNLSRSPSHSREPRLPDLGFGRAY